jgi:hypothetical protein
MGASGGQQACAAARAPAHRGQPAGATRTSSVQGRHHGMGPRRAHARHRLGASSANGSGIRPVERTDLSSADAPPGPCGHPSSGEGAPLRRHLGAEASSTSITGMPSRTGYRNPQAVHTMRCRRSLCSTSPLHAGQTRMSNSRSSSATAVLTSCRSVVPGSSDAVGPDGPVGRSTRPLAQHAMDGVDGSSGAPTRERHTPCEPPRQATRPAWSVVGIRCRRATPGPRRGVAPSRARPLPRRCTEAGVRCSTRGG